MTRDELEESLKLWRARAAFRHARWRHWIKRERNAKNPEDRARAHKLRAKWSDLYDEAHKMGERRMKQVRERNNRRRKGRERSDRRWAGSRYYTNRANDQVNKHRPGTRTTSRKRPVLLGNTSSDHNFFNRTADARDWGLVNDHSMKNIISRENGGPSNIGDFGTWTTHRGGHTYRHQIIAGTHGTGPHLHYGVRRIS